MKFNLNAASGGVSIVGTGSYVPDNIVTNDDLSKIVDTTDEWITTRTGISQRRISICETVSDMAVRAAIKAMDDANIKADEIELIIVATCTTDSFMPSTACIVQKEIGAVNATCFDISAACTGFVYALTTASQYIISGSIKNALIIGSEAMSKILNWEDRNTCVLFGDGAGAAVLSSSSENGIISLYTNSDGTNSDILACANVALENPFINTNNSSSDDDNCEAGNLNSNNKIKRDNKITMNGREVFKFACKVLEESIYKVIDGTGLSLEDIDYFIPHQANYRIIEHVAKKLNVDVNKFYLNLKYYGNTSAASIPLALDEMVKEGRAKKGQRLIVAGFGGGLTYGAALLEWNK